MDMMLIVLIVVLLAGAGIVAFAFMNSDKDDAASSPAKPAGMPAPEPVQPAAPAGPLGPALLSDGPVRGQSIEQFSYKEVISRGWDMTRKYWQPLLVIAVIYLFFQVLGGGLESQAGRNNLSRLSVAAVYKDRAMGDKFYQYLIEAGYITKSGYVLGKLKDRTSMADLTLAPEFADKAEPIARFLEAYRYRLPFPKPVYYPLAITLWLLNMLLMVGFTKVSIMCARDEKPSPAELFLNARNLVAYVLGSICYGLAVIGGFVLLIVPGFICMVMFQMYVYLIVDKGLGPIAALKRSRLITKGYRLRIFTLGFLLTLLNLAGLLCLVVGMYFTIWTSCITMATVYDFLEQKNS